MQMIMGKALVLADKSPDWWRQVATLLVREGDIVLGAYNRHMPSDQAAYILGDPRSNFEAGEHIDMSLALHSEVGVLVAAGRERICYKDFDMFVTTFPCPPCAYAIAESGIRRLFYRDGYSLIAGADSIRAKGIEIIRVLPDAPE